MDLIKILLYLIVFFLLLPQGSFARDLQVGVSPVRLDLGELEPGAEKYASFSLVTQAPEEILVRLGALPAGRDIYSKPENAYLSNISSDTDTSGWVFFPGNPVVIQPANQSLQTLGGSIGGWRSAGFSIQVPQDADPCYHAFQIKPTPYAGAAYGTGVSIAAITVVTVHFKIPGTCIRDGNILDIQQGQGAGEGVGIDTFFKNTGTATIMARVSDVKIYDTNGAEIVSSAGGAQLVKPGKAAILPAYFAAGALESGKTYKATSTVSWGTGSTTRSTILAIEYSKSPLQAEAQPISGGWGAYLSNIMTLIVILIIIVASYLVYKRD